MKTYVVDFIGSDGGWYTYDIYANTVFNAACELLRFERNARITNVALVNKE